MKLEFDRIRTLLLYIEEEVPLGSFAQFESYKSPEDVYTLIKLKEAGYINASINRYNGGNSSVYVTDLTWDGHEFLDNIRSPKAVKHVKSVVETFGSASIQIMSQIAAAFIRSQLGL